MKLRLGHSIVGLLLAGLVASCSTSPASDPVIEAGLTGVGTLPAPASAWPASGFDARRSSGTAAIGPQSGRVNWRRTLSGSLTPGPVIGVDGSILVATNAGVLHALDPATGKDRWSFTGESAYGSDLSTSPTVLNGGLILWPGPGDFLYAIDRTGRLQWREHFVGQPLSPAAAGANRVYVADLDGHLTALEVTATGHRKVWTLNTGGTDYASATVGPDGTIYTASDNELVAVRDLGERAVERWRFKAKSMVEVSNAVSPEGIVVLGTNADAEYGIRSDGKVAWSLHKADFTYSSSVVRPDGTAYFGDNAGHAWAIDAGNAKVRFDVQGNAHPRTASIWTALAVDARGDSYYATVTGHVYGLSASGVQLFDIATGEPINSYPAIGSDGTLYVGTTAGVLYAVHG